MFDGEGDTAWIPKLSFFIPSVEVKEVDPVEEEVELSHQGGLMDDDKDKI